MVEIKDAYKRCYKMRAFGENGINIVVSIPRVVIERETEEGKLQKYPANPSKEGADSGE